MNRHSLVLFVLASVAFAQTKWPNNLTVWFPDGTGLDIHTESNGANSPLSTSGVVAVGAGNDSHRVVLDKESKILFAYDIEARKAGQGTVTMRIKPIDQEKIRSENWYPRHKVSGDIPTLAAAREFPPLRVGDAIQVDILYHPVTQEKIYDVLKVSSEPAPSNKPARLRSEQFSFQEVRIVVDGKTVHEARNSWIIGESVMIYLPGRGSFYLSFSPPPNFPFQHSGWADHNVLRFHAGSELVEVIGKSNVLQKADYRTVWVYHDAKSPAARQFVEVRMADDVTSLIPKKE